MEPHTTVRSPQYSKRFEMGEGDPYSMAIVQELLQGTSEWINIQDIVKLTFKALFDVVKVQGETIRDLERIIPTKASKAELNSGLSQKANVSDVSRTVAEVASTIESRASLEDVQSLVEDKVSRSDLQYAISGKVGVEEMRAALDKKISNDEFRLEMRNAGARFEELQKALQQQTNSAANIRDIEELKIALEQKATITDLNASLQQKASKESVANALKRKANVSDVEVALSKKADVDDMQKILLSLEQKAEYASLEELQKNLEAQLAEQKTEVVSRSAKEETAMNERLEEGQKWSEEKIGELEGELKAFKQRLDEEVENLHRSIVQKGDANDLEVIKATLDRKADIEKTGNELVETKLAAGEGIKQVNSRVDVMVKKLDELKSVIETNVESNYTDYAKLKEQLHTVSEDTRRSLERSSKNLDSATTQLKSTTQEEVLQLKKTIVEIRKEIEELDQKKSDREEVTELNANFVELLEPKAAVVEVQKALTESQTDIAQKLTELKGDLSKELRTLKTTVQAQLDQKANISDVTSTMNTKADKVEVQEVLQLKANATEVEEVKTSVEAVLAEVEKKVDAKSYMEQASNTKSQLEDLHKELTLKSSIKDVCTLVDAKANTEDMNKALVEVHKELEKKANGEDLSNTLADQALINEALCAENCVGRWLWKSGELKNEYAVPWEIQSVNTCPDNFLWEKDRISVLTVAPGLYEITMGFFTKKKPSVQLLINGEVVLSAVNSASYVIHHSSGKIKSVGKHSAGNITGMNRMRYENRTYVD